MRSSTPLKPGRCRWPGQRCFWWVLKISALLIVHTCGELILCPKGSEQDHADGVQSFSQWHGNAINTFSELSSQGATAGSLYGNKYASLCIFKRNNNNMIRLKNREMNGKINTDAIRMYRGPNPIWYLRRKPTIIKLKQLKHEISNSSERTSYEKDYFFPLLIITKQKNTRSVTASMEYI